MKNMKRVLLGTFLCSIIASAVLAVIMFLTSSFDHKITWQILGTMLVIFVSSFAALPLSKRFDDQHSWDSKFGASLVSLSAVLNLVWIWGPALLDDSFFFVKSLLIVNAWALAWTVGTFVLNTKQGAKTLGNISGWGTIFLTLVAALYVSLLILLEFNVSSLVTRLFISDLIFIITGMVVTPLLKRFEK